MRELYRLTSNAAIGGSNQLDVRAGGVIEAAYFDIGALSTAVAAQVFAELTFNSTSQLATNDTSLIIGVCSASNMSGVAVSAFGANQSEPHLNVPVQAGERLFFWTTVASCSQVFASVLIVINSGGDGGGRDPRGRFIRR